MARQSKTAAGKRTAAKAPARPRAKAPAKVPAKAPAPADNRDELGVADLARSILAKAIRPRAGDVVRLAEAVLAGGAKPKKVKKVKADGDKKAKGKKLAKIPGQRAKK
jgi:hypothetical protein